MPRVNPWLLAGLGGAIIMAITQRKTIMVFGSKAIDAAKDAIFAATLPDRAKTYAAIILRVHREEGVDPFAIFAIGDRESLWGTSRALDVQGPGGRGDFGHGHGLMQLDDRDASNDAIIKSGAWRDPYQNVRHAAKKLRAKMRFFESRSVISGLADGSRIYLGPQSAAARRVQPGWYPDPRPLTGAALHAATIAAYNTGEGNVVRSLAVGRPAEFTSAGGDYVTDVASRASRVAADFERNAVV